MILSAAKYRRRKPRITRPPVGLSIVAVKTSTPPEQVKIYFSAPITWNGTDTPTAFMAYTADGFVDSCINVIATGVDWIEVEFNGSVAAGADWQVNTPLVGISPAVTWPQSGTVTA